MKRTLEQPKPFENPKNEREQLYNELYNDIADTAGVEHTATLAEFDLTNLNLTNFDNIQSQIRKKILDKLTPSNSNNSVTHHHSDHKKMREMSPSELCAYTLGQAAELDYDLEADEFSDDDFEQRYVTHQSSGLSDFNPNFPFPPGGIHFDPLAPTTPAPLTQNVCYQTIAKTLNTQGYPELLKKYEKELSSLNAANFQYWHMRLMQEALDLQELTKTAVETKSVEASQPESDDNEEATFLENLIKQEFAASKIQIQNTRQSNNNNNQGLTNLQPTEAPKISSFLQIPPSLAHTQALPPQSRVATEKPVHIPGNNNNHSAPIYPIPAHLRFQTEALLKQQGLDPSKVSFVPTTKETDTIFNVSSQQKFEQINPKLRTQKPEEKAPEQPQRRSSLG